MRTMLTLALGGSMVAAGANDLATGSAKSAQCMACHGPAGISTNPTFPHLAGQNAAYLVRQLERFRSGERYDALMTPVAQSLSDDDISALAMYFDSVGLPAAGNPQR